MKPFFISLLLFFSNSALFAQIVTTSWTSLAFDTTMKYARLDGAVMMGSAQRVVPYEIIYDKNSFIYVVNESSFNWQIEKLNPNDGKTIWQNARNYKTPKLDSAQYFNSDLFFGENNTVEVLGTQLGVRYPNDAFFAAGPAAKAVYDMDTGKEVAYHYLSSRYGRGAWMWNRSWDNFLKKKGGYFIIDPTRYFGQYGMLRKVSNDLQQVDTIRIFTEDSLSKNKSSQRFFEPYYIKNSIYYAVGMIQDYNQWDTTRFFYRYYKLDTLGNILMQKDFNKETFRFFGLMKHQACKDDGFLWAGYADPYKKYGKDDDYEYYIQKLDTNLNIQWRVFLPKKNKKINYAFEVVELQDKQGYLVLNAGINLPDETLLYHVTLDGRAKFLGKIELKDVGEKSFFPKGIVQLPNKDIVFTFGITDCWDGNSENATHCGGTALISYSKIQNSISSTDIDATDDKGFKLFPNPTSDYIQLQFEKAQDGVITLFDLQGKTMQSMEQKEGSNIWEMSVNTISQGVYIVQVRFSNGEIRTERLMKND